MKKFFVSVLVCSVIVGHSEQQTLSELQPQEGVVSARTVRNDQNPLPDDSRRSRGWTVKSFIGMPDDDRSDKAEKEGHSESPLRRDGLPSTEHLTPLQELPYLKEIAAELSVSVSDMDTPGDITYKIVQRIKDAKRQRKQGVECYGGGVLSNETFEMVRSSIPVLSAEKVVVDYHNFIKKIAGKKVVIIEKNEEL